MTQNAAIPGTHGRDAHHGPGKRGKLLGPTRGDPDFPCVRSAGRLRRPSGVDPAGRSVIQPRRFDWDPENADRRAAAEPDLVLALPWLTEEPAGQRDHAREPA